MPKRTDDLGPLPRADGGAELQRISLDALRAALPHGEWVLRDEREEDFGVDVTLEILVRGAATNFRSHVQLKARSNLIANSDGSWSLSVPVANLNYLLSGPTPLYVLFRPESSELFVVSARDELRRIEATNPAWREQRDVTLRLADRLDPKALAQIRERIIREARGNRELLDLAVSLAPGSRVQVDAATLQCRSPAEAEQLLLETGMTAVTHGFGNQVLDLCSAVDTSRFAALPKLLLVRGYAEFFAGRYLRADAPLREALATGDKLQENDRHFVRFLVEAVNLALGHTTAEVFRGRSTAWRAAAPEMLAAQYDVLHLWTLRNEKTSREERATHDRTLRIAIARIVAIPGAPPALVHYAESLRLFLDAQDWAMRLIDVLGASSDPFFWNLRHSEPPATVLGREIAAVAAWRTRADALANAVGSAGNIPRYCEIRLTRDLCEEMFLTHLGLAAIMSDRPPPPVPDALMSQVRSTRALAAKHGQVEFELRSALVESALEELRGDDAAARRILEDVQAKASALRYADVERVARRALDEGGHHAARRREIAAVKADGFESFFAQLPEDDVAELAREVCEKLDLPAGRVSVLIDAVRCERAAAQERRGWCRHLRVLEEAPPEMSSTFLYARPPKRCCACERFEHRSMVTSADWASIILTFKRVYCGTCPSREPRTAQAQP